MLSGYSSSVSDSCFLPRFSSNVVLASRKLSMWRGRGHGSNLTMVFNLQYLRQHVSLLVFSSYTFYAPSRRTLGSQQWQIENIYLQKRNYGCFRRPQVTANAPSASNLFSPQKWAETSI